MIQGKMRSFAKIFEPLTPQVRSRSREDCLLEALESIKSNGEILIFAYGSLLWDTPFAYKQKHIAHLEGWQRNMCVWSALARGTPELPGLGLGLVPGGSCDGIAFQVEESNLKEAFYEVWTREMWTNVYNPTWVPIVKNGKTNIALTFTVNQSSEQYASGLVDEDLTKHIAHAEGERGLCSDYLSSTVDKLKEFGIRDIDLELLNYNVKKLIEINEG